MQNVQTIAIKCIIKYYLDYTVQTVTMGNYLNFKLIKTKWNYKVTCTYSLATFQVCNDHRAISYHVGPRIENIPINPESSIRWCITCLLN